MGIRLLRRKRANAESKNTVKPSVENTSESSAKNQGKSTDSSKADNPPPSEEETDKVDNKPKRKNKGESFFQRLANSTKSIYNNIKEFRETENKTLVVKLCFRFLAKLFRALNLKKLMLRGEVGFENPSDTGLFFGAFWALTGILDNVPINNRIIGNYNEKVFTVDAQLSGRTTIWGLLFPFAVFLFQPSVWALYKKFSE